MKKFFSFVGLFVLVILILVVARAGSQAERPIETGTAAPGWVAIGPEGGNIQSMAFHPSNSNEISAVIRGYPSAVYRTMNGGQSWQRIALITDSINDIDYDPLNANILYAPASSRLWKSTNGGGSWSSSSFPSYYYNYGPLAVHPASSNVLYGCGNFYSGGSYYVAFVKSTDSGANWTMKTVSPAGPYAQSYALAISPADPNMIYLSGHYYSGSGYFYYVYRSSDSGNTWANVTGSIGTNYPICGLAVDPTDANKVYAGTSWGIFRSADAGATWIKNSGYAYSYALAVDRNNPNTIYSGYIKEVYKSTDGGVNWIKSTGMFGTCTAILAANTSIFFSSDAGIYRSLDAGGNWLEANSGMKASNVIAVAASSVSPNILYCEVSGLGFFRSQNYGASWSRCPDFYRCDSITRILTGPTDRDEVFILAGG